MTNAEWIQKRGIRFTDLKWRASGKEQFDIMAGTQGIVGCLKIVNARTYTDPRLVWLDMEHHEEPILDDAEKRYLKAVIRPWRDKVLTISKRNSDAGMFIEIECQSIGLGSELIQFPNFPSGTMYKGMERGREYSLEELGL